MDRSIVYPASIPLDTDILNIQRRTMIALGSLLQATFGTSTLVDGLACSATNPASMTVNVGPGSIIAYEPLESTPYGSLPADTSDAIVKQGINIGSTSFTLAAPSSAGQTINYLIEATLAETDGSPVVLPYYNSANPSQPYSGPNNSGTPQNTQRTQTVSLELKAGAPATTGTQVTPAVDIGYVGLYVISVSNGAVGVFQSNISVYPGAPFVGPKLGSLGIRRKLASNFTVSVSTSGNDAIALLTGGATPFASVQAAVNYIQNNLDLNGYATGILVGPGTFTGPVKIIGSPPGASYGYPIAINGSGPTQTIIQASNDNALTVTGGASVIIGQMAIQATSPNPSQLYGQGGIGVLATGGGQVGVNAGIYFGSCDVSHMVAGYGGLITTGGNPYTISGGARYHVTAAPGGDVTVVNSAVTILGSVSFLVAFVYAYGGGCFQSYGCSFTGSATGPRYLAALNGSVNVNGAGTSFLPGNSAGSLSSGGQYA